MYMYFLLEFRMISLTLFVEYATLKTVAEYYSRLHSEPFIQPIFIDTVRFVSAFFFFSIRRCSSLRIHPLGRESVGKRRCAAERFLSICLTVSSYGSRKVNEVSYEYISKRNSNLQKHLVNNLSLPLILTPIICEISFPSTCVIKFWEPSNGRIFNSYNILLFTLKILAYFHPMWYIIGVNCGGRLRTTPREESMRRLLLFA